MKYRFSFDHYPKICILLAGAALLAGCGTVAPDHSQNRSAQFANFPGLEAPAGDATTVPKPAEGATVVPPPAGSSGVAPSVGAAKGQASVDMISGDSLLVVSFQDLPQPVTPFEQKVHDDGTITLLLNQTFVATNKSCRELEREIRQLYVPKLFKQMTVTVAISGNTRFFYVEGEVKVPARQPWLGRMTLRQAITSCGDFTDFANKKKVSLTHEGGARQIINMKKVIAGEAPDPDVLPGDKIHVYRKWW